MPDPPKSAPGAQKDDGAPAKSRLEVLQDRHGKDFDPPMPPLECGEHLIEWLWEVGPTEGKYPLSHTELAAFQRNTGICLTEWSVTTLRRLSIEYLSESHRAKKRDCPPPWEESDLGRVLATGDARDALRALANL